MGKRGGGKKGKGYGRVKREKRGRKGGDLGGRALRGKEGWKKEKEKELWRL